MIKSILYRQLGMYKSVMHCVMQCIIGFCLLLLIGYIGYLINPTFWLRIYSAFKDLIYVFIGQPGITNDPISKPDGIPDNIFSAPVPSYLFHQIRVDMFGKSLLNVETYQRYYNSVLDVVLIILFVILIILPFILIYRYYKDNKKAKITTELKISKPLIKWFKIMPTINKIANYISNIARVVFSNKIFKFLFVLLILLESNLLSQIIDFISYYILIITYFFKEDISFFEDLYYYFFRVFYDLKYILRFSFLFLPIFCKKIKKKFVDIAISRLCSFDNMNKTLIKLMPFLIFIDGEPGTGKTLAMNDMSDYAEELLREKALKEMIDMSLMFPQFNWRQFEAEIELQRVQKRFVKWGKVENFINSLIVEEKIFGYDIKAEYRDGLIINKFLDVLADYACLYLLYTTNKVLIFSNYGKRSNNELVSVGNFPLYDTCVYNKSEDITLNENYAVNLIRDMTRTGKKKNPNDKMIGAYEFGVFVETEADKEYGNKNTNEGQRRDDVEVNSKNDGANIFKMLIRHYSTKHYTAYTKWFYDAQRKDSVNAGLVQISTVLHLLSKSEQKNTFPFFGVIDRIYAHLEYYYTTYIVNCKFSRADWTLRQYLIDLLFSKVHKLHKNLINKYSYSDIHFVFEKGNGVGNSEEHIYRLMTKRAYSNTYATDAYHDMLVNKDNVLGFDDFERFHSIYATKEEFERQGSRAVADILNINNDKVDEFVDNYRLL